MTSPRTGAMLPVPTMTRDTNKRLRRAGNEMVSFGACWPTTTVGAMVNLTRIYTRTGDGGETRLGDLSVTTKTDTRLHAYADVDEANAQLGVALAHGDFEEDVRAVLIHVQNDLFDVGADLATPVVAEPEYPPLRIEQDYIDRLEGWCDHYNEDLPALRSFILNGGTPARPTSTSRAPSYAARSGPAGRLTPSTARR